MSDTRELALDVAVGIVAGLAATKVTEFAQQGPWALTPEETRDKNSGCDRGRPSASRPRRPPSSPAPISTSSRHTAPEWRSTTRPA